MTETAHTPLPELLRELSKVIVDHLGGGSEWFTRVGDDFYVDPKAIGPELRRRKTDAQITKKALFRANTRADSHHRLVEALRGLLDEIGKSGCADTILDSAAAGKAFVVIAEVEGRRG